MYRIEIYAKISTKLTFTDQLDVIDDKESITVVCSEKPNWEIFEELKESWGERNIFSDKIFSFAICCGRKGDLYNCIL